MYVCLQDPSELRWYGRSEVIYEVSATFSMSLCAIYMYTCTVYIQIIIIVHVHVLVEILWNL